MSQKFINNYVLHEENGKKHFFKREDRIRKGQDQRQKLRRQEHRKYVETLVMIEQYFAGEMRSWITNYWVRGIKKKLPEEFIGIGEEMKPRFKAGFIKEKKKEAEEQKKTEERHAKKAEEKEGLLNKRKTR